MGAVHRLRRAKKNPACAGSFASGGELLHALDVGSLLAFRALRDCELDFLTFFEGLKTGHIDCGEVREQILAAVIRSDEAKTFGIIEPLNSTSCHKRNFQLKTNHTSHKSKKLLAPSSACSLLINKYISTMSITALLVE